MKEKVIKVDKGEWQRRRKVKWRGDKEEVVKEKKRGIKERNTYWRRGRKKKGRSEGKSKALDERKKKEKAIKEGKENKKTGKRGKEARQVEINKKYPSVILFLFSVCFRTEFDIISSYLSFASVYLSFLNFFPSYSFVCFFVCLFVCLPSYLLFSTFLRTFCHCLSVSPFITILQFFPLFFSFIPYLVFLPYILFVY